MMYFSLTLFLPLSPYNCLHCDGVVEHIEAALNVQESGFRSQEAVILKVPITKAFRAKLFRAILFLQKKSKKKTTHLIHFRA